MVNVDAVTSAPGTVNSVPATAAPACVISTLCMPLRDASIDSKLVSDARQRSASSNVVDVGSI